jgi:TolB protein
MAGCGANWHVPLADKQPVALSVWNRLRSFATTIARVIVTCFAAIVSASGGDEPVTTTIEQVSDAGAPKSCLTFRDADNLVYVEETGPRQLALLELTLSTGEIARLHPDFVNNQFGPAYSPAGTHFAYIKNIGNLNLRLVIENIEDHSSFEFGEDGFSGMQAPCFTPDGTRLLYSFPTDGRTHIWSCDLRCEDRRKEVDSSGINNWPTCTPDGLLVYASTRDGNYEIYSQPLAGGPAKRLTDSPTQDIRPVVDPEGRWIAFTSARDGNYEIYRMNLDGTGLVRLTNNPDQDDHATVSPTGGIYFVAEEAGQFRIERLNLAESESPAE